MIFSLQDALAGLAGGAMIGLAAALMLLGVGRIAGVSGIIGGLIRSSARRLEDAAFIVGLIAAPALFALLAGAPQIVVTGALPVLIAGGLLVGFGTRMGSGCTSGHGVCGLSRLSRRSLAATCVFMFAAAAMTAAARLAAGG